MVWAENLIDGHRVLPVVLADLRSATGAIHVAMFLFFDDPIGEEISRILEEKARAGVKVRVLLNVEKTDMADPFRTGEEEMMEEDPGFHRDPTDVTAMRKRLEAAGAEVLDTELDYDEIVETGDEQIDEVAREIRESVKVDAMHVDHRKIVTIDGRVAYCGSANFGGQYLHHRAMDPRKETHEEADEARDAGLPEPWWRWHDGLVRFEGEIVEPLDRVFRERWLLGGGEDFTPIPSAAPTAPRGIRVDSVCIVKNEPSSRTNAIRIAFLERIAAARESIFLENPYLYHPAIVAALLEAKRRRPSLRIRLIVPARDWNDSPFSADAQQHHYRSFLAAGIEVHEFRNHFTHLKLAVFDERWSIVGSANLNFRSLEDDKDFECCVVIDGRDFARSILRDVRDVDLRVAERIRPRDLRRFTLHGLRTRLRDLRTLFLLRVREI